MGKRSGQIGEIFTQLGAGSSCIQGPHLTEGSASPHQHKRIHVRARIRIPRRIGYARPFRLEKVRNERQFSRVKNGDGSTVCVWVSENRVRNTLGTLGTFLILVIDNGHALLLFFAHSFDLTAAAILVQNRQACFMSAVLAVFCLLVCRWWISCWRRTKTLLEHVCFRLT
jgi:hypothetical protein